MFVPNADRAFIDLKKLAAYSLDSTHDVGKHKAVVFGKVLGLHQADANKLADALMFAVNNLEAEPGKSDLFGQRYMVDLEMSRNLRTATIRSV